MKQQLKYLKLFEGLKPSEIPFGTYDDRNRIVIKFESNETIPDFYDDFNSYEIWGVEVEENKNIKEINSFNKLEKIENYLFIMENPKLNNVDGFNSLIECFRIGIRHNDKLQYVSGFNGIPSTGVLDIMYNKSLNYIDGFNSLELVSKLDIRTNRNLKYITGFKNLKEIQDKFFMSGGKENSDEFIFLSIPKTIISSSMLENSNGIRIEGHDDGFFYSAESFVNNIRVIHNLIGRIDKYEYPDIVYYQIWENLKQWATQQTIDIIVHGIPPHIMDKFPDDFKHLHHPDYKSTSGRDVAKLNTGQIYGIF